jgi:hypothetical protein
MYFNNASYKHDECNFSLSEELNGSLKYKWITMVEFLYRSLNGIGNNQLKSKI